jgi:UDP-N-acetylmuramate dehydrogenase
MKIEEQIPLAPHTTFKIGGPARYYAVAETLDELREALAFAHEGTLPIFILGGGSNVVIADEGFDGLVIVPKFETVEVKQTADGAEAHVTAGAGVVWDAFIADMVGKGLHGLESLSGVPGTVGGAVVANAGAYGTELADVFIEARVIDLLDEKHEIMTFDRQACRFSYHDSFFSQEPGRYLILDVTMQLTQGEGPDFAYRDNRFNFTDVMKSEDLPHTYAGLRSAVLLIREKKGVLEHCYQSAGSFFHMPYVSQDEYAQIARVAQELDAAKEERLRPWAWEQTDGRYKIAPGFLLEYTPFHKGYVRGAVGISPKHTLSIINLGGATASDVATLARDMHDAVQNIFNISLEREVQYVGDVKEK